MKSKDLTESHRKECVETLTGLRTLVEMQQVLIARALERIGPNGKTPNKPGTRSTAGKKKPTG